MSDARWEVGGPEHPVPLRRWHTWVQWEMRLDVDIDSSSEVGRTSFRIEKGKAHAASRLASIASETLLLNADPAVPAGSKTDLFA